MTNLKLLSKMIFAMILSFTFVVEQACTQQHDAENNEKESIIKIIKTVENGNVKVDTIIFKGDKDMIKPEKLDKVIALKLEVQEKHLDSLAKHLSEKEMHHIEVISKIDSISKEIENEVIINKVPAPAMVWRDQHSFHVNNRKVDDDSFKRLAEQNGWTVTEYERKLKGNREVIKIVREKQ